MGFFDKFFGYFKNDDGVMEPYQSGGGGGTFLDVRHYIVIVSTILIAVALYLLFRKYKRAGKWFTIIFATYLFFVRLTNQTIRAFIGAELPFWRAFPFHMCTVMTFLLPIVLVFNIKALKMPVYILSIMGGIITIIIGDYYADSFMVFYFIESIVAHILLITLPLVEIAIGKFSIDYKKSWTVILAVLVLMGWATLANKVFFSGQDTNYMYLEDNELPADIGGDLYLLVYAVIFLLVLAIIVFTPEVYRASKRKVINK